MGHATTADMLTHFKNGMALLNPSSLMQISMDGPNVNGNSIAIFFKNAKVKKSFDNLPSCQQIRQNCEE